MNLLPNVDSFSNDLNVPALVYYLQDSQNENQVLSDNAVNQLFFTFPQSNSNDTNSFLNQITLHQLIGTQNANSESKNAVHDSEILKGTPGRPRKDGLPTNRRFTIVTCQECGVKCRSGVMFQRHINLKHPEKNLFFKCDICPLSYQDENEYLDHFFNHWKSGEKCPKPVKKIKSCNTIFTRRAALRAHLQRYHVKKNEDLLPQPVQSFKNISIQSNPYPCSQCERSFDKPSHLKRHILSHTKEKPFSCDHCNKKFSQKNSLIRHIDAHNNDSFIPCQKCPAKFRQMSNLNNHVKRLHPEGVMKDTRTKCDHCECYFQNNRQIFNHILRMHPEVFDGDMGKQVEIETTPSSTDVQSKDILQAALSSSGLVSGVTIKRDKNKTVIQHTCLTCSKTFKKISDLERHVKIHLAVKKYGCDMCDRRFHLITNLQSHVQNIHLKRMSKFLEQNESIIVEQQLLDDSGIPQISIPEYNNTPDMIEISNVAPLQPEEMINLIPNTNEPFLEDNILSDINNSDLLSADIISASQSSKSDLFLPDAENGISIDIPNDASMPLLTPLLTPLPLSMPLLSSNDVNLLDSSVYVQNIPQFNYLSTESMDLLQNQNLITVNDETSHLVSTAIDPNLPNMNITKNNPESDNTVRDTFLSLEQFKETLKAPKTTYKMPVLPNACTFCPASFKKNSDLEIHTRIHTKEKPFQCQECWKKFSSKNSLRLHQVVHLSKGQRKTQKCPLCQKELLMTTSMAVHMRYHNKETPFKCPFCEASFHTVGNRNHHLRVHFKEVDQ